MILEAKLQRRLGAFSLDVALSSPGPVLGIFGASGSGKSTLLHVLAGLLPAHAAEITVAGRLLCRRPGGIDVPPEQRRLAIVTQDPLLFPHLGVRGNLCYAPGATAALDAEAGRRIRGLLRLDPLLDRPVANLSGGERQRVALGRALLSAPSMLLLDEPTSALDAELARDVLSLLFRVKAELGLPMLFVTHRAGELMALCDDCVVLEAGRIVAQGPPVQVLARPRALSVANLVGVDNLLRLPVVAHDEAGGTSVLELGGAQLAVPLCSASVGEEVSVGLYADEILLCLSAPQGLSARNAIAATVTSSDPVGREVLVGLLAGTTPLLARISPAAARELVLEPGKRVVAVVKSSSCHLLGG